MVIQKNQRSSLRTHLIRGAFGSLVLKVSQVGLNFLMAVILARFLGVDGFGTYAFCLSIVNLLTIPAMLGGQHLLVREAAAYQARNELKFLKGLLKWISQMSTVTSIILSLCAGGIGWLVFHGTPICKVYLASVCLVPLLTLLNLRNAALRGLHRVLIGQASTMFVPLIFIFIISIIYLFFTSVFTPAMAVIIYGISICLMVLLTGVMLRQSLPEQLKKVEPSYDPKRWVKSIMPFLLIGVIQAFNTEASVLFLGIMKNSESVGLFRVAQKGAELISFGLLAVNMAIAPTVAKLYAKGEKERLQNIIAKSILLITAFSLPVATGLIIFGNFIISFVFGQEYYTAYAPLVVLCIGKLFSVFSGSVGITLNMIGLERLVTRGIIVAVLINICLNYLWIPCCGIIGAAVASSISLVVLNLLLVHSLYKETGIVSFFRLKYIIN